MKRVGVIGGGAWGTALAQVGARAGLEVRLWVREPDVALAINETRQNLVFLKGIQLEPGISAVTRTEDLTESDLVFAAPPAQHFRTTLAAFAGVIAPQTPVVICAKGIEARSLKLMSEVLAEVMPQVRPAVLSGPSFADEVARGLPTAVTLAADTEDEALAMARAIANAHFRPYASTDMIGAQAGGAVKNVLAIACGMVEGRRLGANAKAALITRGFAELNRLAVAMGGASETAAGLCGLGDLVLTCGGGQSRNMSVGLALGRGQSLEVALAGKLSVAEGVASAPAVVALAKRLGVDAPICEAVSDILAGRITIDPAMTNLLSRPLRTET